MLRTTICLALSLLLWCGCSHRRPRLLPSPNTLPQDPRLSDLERAQLLQDQGDHVAASIEFRKIIDCTADDGEREEARIGAAKSLIRMQRYAPALAILGPLPAVAESETDSRRLAIAGEILLRQKRTEEAEVCLERALDGFPLEVFVPGATNRGVGGAPLPHLSQHPVAPADYQTLPAPTQENGILEPVPPGIAELPPGIAELPPLSEPGSGAWVAPDASGPGLAPEFLLAEGTLLPPAWLAACCANLGLAYLKNGKPEQASVMYEFAAHLSRQRGNQLAAQRAERLHEELSAVLRQYAPYKPHPVSQRFPPGKE